MEHKMQWQCVVYLTYNLFARHQNKWQRTWEAPQMNTLTKFWGKRDVNTFFFLCSWLCHDPWLLIITCIKCLQQHFIVPFKELMKYFWVFITYTTPCILLWKENMGTARVKEELTPQIFLLFSVALQVLPVLVVLKWLSYCSYFYKEY